MSSLLIEPKRVLVADFHRANPNDPLTAHGSSAPNPESDDSPRVVVRCHHGGPSLRPPRLLAIPLRRPARSGLRLYEVLLQLTEHVEREVLSDLRDNCFGVRRWIFDVLHRSEV